MEAARLKTRAARFTLLEGILYKHSFAQPYLQSLSTEEGWEIQDWCGKRSIQQRFTSVTHLQANGKVEVTNCILVQGIKIKPEEASGQWVDTLLNGHIEFLPTPPQEKLLSI
ncbi:UNVERIFIED_CONTAM: hypothetical protein Sradi_6538000 [Sesamum radiatum]|uniref:Uncharacterized protein n=1 Tax=Sesamum radiatum TaxID=300843 RepID=A0AAW2JWM0_SESRA